MANPLAKVSANDRFSYTLFLALIIHTLVALGLNFLPEEHSPKTQSSLSVTLAQRPSTLTPEQADFLADHDQQGSGQSKEKKKITTDQQPLLSDSQYREITPPTQAEAQPKQSDKTRKRLATQSSQTRTIANQQKNKHQTKPSEQQQNKRKKLNIQSEIASLEAEYANKRQSYSKRPRKHVVNSATTRKDKGAYYQIAWHRKVERFGNINYPQEARRKKLYGELRLEVVIKSSGELKEVNILESSGQPVLDEAALRIIKLAAPYGPFTGELAREVDELYIIRTWRFEKGNYLSGR